MRAVLLATAVATSGLVATTARADERVHAASGLTYEVVPPTGWDGQAPVDVLVCLHGSGDQLSTFRRGLRVVAPGVRRFLCVFVQSPDAQGWPSSALDGVAAIASEARAGHPGHGLFAFGYSAGGNLASSLVYQRPDVFEGAVVAGATGARQPPNDARVHARRLYWALNPDDTTFGGREAVERLRGWLTAAGYDPARWRIDLREEEGLGHGLDGAAVERGLEWLRAETLAEVPATDDDRARVAEVAALVSGKGADPDALRALAAPILEARRGEARALLAAALEGLPRHRDAALSLAGIELLGRLGVPASVDALAGALSRLQRDPARHVAAVRALGQLGGPEAAKALLGVLRRRDGDLSPQVAAAEALARVGGRAEVRALVAELNEAERERREALAAAIDAALHELTGHELSGGRVWRAWWEQVGKKAR